MPTMRRPPSSTSAPHAKEPDRSLRRRLRMLTAPSVALARGVHFAWPHDAGSSTVSTTTAGSKRPSAPLFAESGYYSAGHGPAVAGRGGWPAMAWPSAEKIGMPCLRRVEM